ncbi:sugar phosphate isomerase/epimerase [Thalassotalea fonticola]|uniref:Sugar phosphate isomerase/epimerase n=1 Tax=Thalassotalea fonticola TaxID=3065649 RepID=A0ABZ0GLB6_9GAMM|nr:sugar phosphate isomerase/epimerase [Colwelliaceae bacterium S1-1]
MNCAMNMFLWTTHVTKEHLPELKLVKNSGYNMVEIPILNVDDISHYQWLGEQLKDIGLIPLSITARGEEDNPCSPDPAVRQLAVNNNKRAIDCANALGANKISGLLHTALGVFTGQGPTSQEWQWSVEVMRETAAYAQKMNIEISLEFINRFECYLTNTTADMARLVKDIDYPNVGILYDTFHANIEEKDVAEAIRENAHLINHVHISENDRSTPGSGHVRWDETFAALEEVGYNGTFAVEAFGLNLPELIPVVKIWRKMYESEEQICRDAYQFIKSYRVKD